MDKSIIGLLSGASALALIGGAQAAPAPTESAVQPASSFAELLDPCIARENDEYDGKHAARMILPISVLLKPVSIITA